MINIGRVSSYLHSFRVNRETDVCKQRKQYLLHINMIKEVLFVDMYLKAGIIGSDLFQQFQELKDFSSTKFSEYNA